MSLSELDEECGNALLTVLNHMAVRGSVSQRFTVTADTDTGPVTAVMRVVLENIVEENKDVGM